MVEYFGVYSGYFTETIESSNPVLVKRFEAFVKLRQLLQDNHTICAINLPSQATQQQLSRLTVNNARLTI